MSLETRIKLYFWGEMGIPVIYAHYVLYILYCTPDIFLIFTFLYFTAFFSRHILYLPIEKLGAKEF